MAMKGDIIEHPVTGERIIFRKTAQDTSGELLQAELVVKPHGFVAAKHIHPLQEERFEMLAGKVKLRMNGEDREIKTGEVAIIPPQTSHIWWNDSDQEAHVLVEIRPALRTEAFFETFFALAQAGTVDKKTGLPNPLILALMMREFDKEICLARPPLAVQRILFGLLALVGRLLGYKGQYPYPYKQ